MKNQNSMKISNPLLLALLIGGLQLGCNAAPETAPITNKTKTAADSTKSNGTGDESSAGSDSTNNGSTTDTTTAGNTIKNPAPANPNVPAPVPAPTTPAPAPAPTTPTADNPKLPCTEATEACHPHRFIVVDEALRKMGYVNLDDPSKDWDLNLPGGGRDLQLIGGGKVMVGTLEGSGGYNEVDLVTGKITKSVTDFGGVMSIQRLKSGNTLVMGGGLAGGRGTVILEVKGDHTIVKKMEFPDANGGRLIRRTKAGTFLIGSTQASTPGNDVMIEYTADGKELLRLDAKGVSAHMGLRLPNGDTVVANGHSAAVLIYDKNKKIKATLGGKDQAGKDPVHFYYGGQFQVLNNGHFVLTNWQGHDANLGNSGRQLVEYDANGVQVWSWKQDPKRFSSIHGVIVLDNLDTNLIYDDTNGALAPAE